MWHISGFVQATYVSDAHISKVYEATQFGLLLKHKPTNQRSASSLVCCTAIMQHLSAGKFSSIEFT